MTARNFVAASAMLLATAVALAVYLAFADLTSLGLPPAMTSLHTAAVFLPGALACGFIARRPPWGFASLFWLGFWLLAAAIVYSVHPERGALTASAGLWPGMLGSAVSVAVATLAASWLAAKRHRQGAVSAT